MVQKIFNPNISNLLLIDRAAFENKDSELAPIFDKLVLVDCVPRKKDGFVNYTSALCKVEKEIAERAWDVLEKTKAMLPAEKRKTINKLVRVCGNCVTQKPVIKKEKNFKKQKKEKTEKKKKAEKPEDSLAKRVERLITLHKNV